MISERDIATIKEFYNDSLSVDFIIIYGRLFNTVKLRYEYASGRVAEIPTFLENTKEYAFLIRAKLVLSLQGLKNVKNQQLIQEELHVSLLEKQNDNWIYGDFMNTTDVIMCRTVTLNKIVKVQNGRRLEL